MQIPDTFVKQMQTYYPQQWPELELALQQPAIRAVRLQKYTLHTSHEGEEGPNAQNDTDNVANSKTALSLPKTSPWLCAGPLPTAPTGVANRLTLPVPWYEGAYYVPADSEIGKSVVHELGGVYLQEASATAAVAALNPRPSERILDLCAAPGSKTTAIGRRLQADSLLYANEIHPGRAKILAQNLERAGIPAVITNNHPDTLADVWADAFDAVLVDAPCSGEGMFRKDPTAVAEWSPQNVQLCVSRQREILTAAVRMVKPGGRLVYSTCTLNPLENEQVAAWACANLPLQLDTLPQWQDWEPGRPELADGNSDLTFTRRLWPFSGSGEGHFVARFRVVDKPLSGKASSQPTRKLKRERTVGSLRQKASVEDWTNWLNEWVDVEGADAFNHGNSLVVRPTGLYAGVNQALPLSTLSVLRDGIRIGYQHHERKVPDHQFAMALHPELWHRHRELDAEEVRAYLSGASLAGCDTQGFVGLSYAGLPAGLAKSAPGRLNNLYPKGLRRANLLTQL